MSILKSDEGLVQLHKCPKCSYLVVWVNMFFQNEKPVICKWCNAQQGRVLNGAKSAPKKRSKNSKRSAATRTQINEYVKTLDDVLQKLYKQVETAYLLTLHDTSSDEFQIVANMRDVFSVQTEAQLNYMSEGFEYAEQTFAVDGGDSLPSHAVTKPNLLSSLVAFFKPTHRH